MTKISNLIEDLVISYKKKDDLVKDPLRGGERVEIPSGFALAILSHRLKENYDFAEKLLNIIIQMQQPRGEWLEYDYRSDEETLEGFSGAIPTCLAILALVEGYNELGEKKFLRAAFRGAEYLYRNESDGYFLKASLNRSDVVNTNLLSGLALLRVGSLLPKDATEKEAFRFAASRALRRSISSQFLSGAYPYISYGFRVPYLYHAMSLALIGFYSKYFEKDIINYSFVKGLDYLNEIIDEKGRFLWEKAKNKDKEGAIWSYGWAILAFSLYSEDKAELMLEQLEEKKQNNFLQSGDFDKREDVFYTAWVLLGLSLMGKEKYEVKRKNRFLEWLTLRLLTLPSKTRYLFQIITRNYLKFFIDKGPPESR